jgi:HK97 family phage prohead protease
MGKPKLFGSVEQFRREAKDAETPLVESEIRASFNTEVKVKDGADRTLIFTISTDSVDRMGDTIAVAGWDLDNYRKNPVVLWAHDSSSLPVARCNKLWIEGKKLKAETEFTPLGMAKFNDVVYDMYIQGFLSATSVGFMPTKYAFVDDPERRWGIDFLEQELLEFSCVPVPANPEALIDAKAAGIDTAAVRDWAEKILQTDGLAVIDRKKLEAIVGLPTKFRTLAHSLPEKAKGARGQLLRCANIAEREIAPAADEADASALQEEATEEAKQTGTETETEQPAAAEDGAAEAAGTPRRDMARRRLDLTRARVA